MKADEHGRMFRGLSHAVCEMVLGTGIFFSHKKQITVIEGNTWAFEAVLPHLYKLGFQVQVLAQNQLPSVTASAADWTAWVEALHKETNFVLWCEDHPVTGEWRDLDAMDKALAQKRILSIAVSHSSHCYHQRELSPYSVRIQNLSHDFAWARLGSRVRTPALFAHRLIWGDSETQQLKKLMQTSNLENQKLVQSVETELVSRFGFKVFPFQGLRLWDRLVVWHPERNAQALADSLRQGLGSIGTESITACNLAVLPEYSVWWKPLPADDILRGLLILGTEAISVPSLLAGIQSSLDQSIFRQDVNG